MASLIRTHSANMLTSVRILLVPVFVAGALSGELLFAATVFSIAGVTDLLDGYTARRFNTVTALGVALDPLADKLMLTSAFLTLGATGLLPLWLCILVALRDSIMLSVIFMAKRAGASLNTSPTACGKATTFTQCACVLTTLLLANVAPVDGIWLLHAFVAVITVLGALLYAQREFFNIDLQLNKALKIKPVAELKPLGQRIYPRTNIV